MKTAVRANTGLIVMLLLVVLVALALILMIANPDLRSRGKGAEVTVDPHEGQVYIYDGFDWVWMTPLEGVPVNDFAKEEFQMVGNTPVYLGSGYETILGVDVSEHQYEVDWQQAKEAGVDFAFIRIGRRGYTEGGLFNDPWFEKNMQGASDAGLRVGVYFFSQAVNVAEAIEEANFVLSRVAPYSVTAPVVYDWELVSEEGSRTAELSAATRTDCAVAFCETIRRAGYTPCVYFNRDMGYYGYDLTRLTDYMFWFSLPLSPFPNFYYACDMWQYSFTEEVPGVTGYADMNLWFIPRPQEQSAESVEGKT